MEANAGTPANAETRFWTLTEELLTCIEGNLDWDISHVVRKSERLSAVISDLLYAEIGMNFDQLPNPLRGFLARHGHDSECDKNTRITQVGAVIETQRRTTMNRFDRGDTHFVESFLFRASIKTLLVMLLFRTGILWLYSRGLKPNLVPVPG